MKSSRSVTHVVEEFAVLGGPSDLHDAGGDDPDLVEPDPGPHLKSAPDALEGGRVATGLQKQK